MDNQYQDNKNFDIQSETRQSDTQAQYEANAAATGATTSGAASAASAAATAASAAAAFDAAPTAHNADAPPLHYAAATAVDGADGAYMNDQAQSAVSPTREEWERQQREIQDREWQSRQMAYNRQIADSRAAPPQQWRADWRQYNDGRYDDRRQYGDGQYDDRRRYEQYRQGIAEYGRQPYNDEKYNFDARQQAPQAQYGQPDGQSEKKGGKSREDKRGARKPYMQIIAAGVAGALIASAVFIAGFFIGSYGLNGGKNNAQPQNSQSDSAYSQVTPSQAQAADTTAPANESSAAAPGRGGFFRTQPDRPSMLPPDNSSGQDNAQDNKDASQPQQQQPQQQQPQQQQSQTPVQGQSAQKNQRASLSLALNPPRDIEMTVPEIYQKVYPSIVGIRITFASQGYRFGGIMMPGYEQSGEGSGIIIHEDGYIMTNHHVVSVVIDNNTRGQISDAKIEVFLPDDSTTAYPATVIGYDQSTDLCVLKIDKTGLKAAELGDSDKLVVGEFAVAIGNPGGMEYMSSVTYGVISGLNRSIRTEGYRNIRLIQTDAAINPGNSGGALINKSGQIVGVNSIKIADSSYEGLGFAIPINDAVRICEDLLNYTYVTGRPYIGITAYSQYTEQMAKQYNMPEGVYVYEVDDNGPSRSIISKNDIIVRFANVDTPNFDALETEKNKHKPGDKVTIRVYRDWSTNDYTSGKYVDLEIVLGEKKN